MFHVQSTVRINRRGGLWVAAVAAMGAAAIGLRWSASAVADAPAGAPASQPAATGVAPDEALARLKAGNARFVTNKPAVRELTEVQRQELTSGQAPFAMILSCADSRIPPEIIFDQFKGDLFVVRVAGNITDPALLGSLEFAHAVLGANLLVVLGHESCGAVRAAQSGEAAPGNIQVILDQIKPGITESKNRPGDPVANATVDNVQHVIRTLPERSTILGGALAGGKLKAVGGVYHISKGEVEWLPPAAPAPKAP